MDPSTGTFTSMDTYGGSLSDPMSLHKYLFANSNPVMYSDPSGHFTLTECQKSMLIGATLSSISYSAIWGIASLIDAHSGTNYSAGFSLTGLICSIIYGALLGGLGLGFSIAFKALHLTFMQYIGLSVFCILIGLDLKVWSYFEGKSGDVILSAILGTLGDTSYVAGGAAVGTAVNARNNPLGLHDYGKANKSKYAQGENSNSNVRKKIALGLSDYLDDFASKNNAETWKDFPDPYDWKNGVLDALYDPNTDIIVNLDGVDSPYLSAQRAAAGYGGATDWELLQLKLTPEAWSRTTWYLNGKVVPNPFQ